MFNIFFWGRIQYADVRKHHFIGWLLIEKEAGSSLSCCFNPNICEVEKSHNLARIKLLNLGLS
jgi:hypothetical protein